MKKLQRLCAATILLFALSVSALAGNIHTNVIDPPPPPPPDSATFTEPAHIGTDATTDPTQNPIESNTLATEITLSLLRLLSVV